MSPFSKIYGQNDVIVCFQGKYEHKMASKYQEPKPENNLVPHLDMPNLKV